MPDNFSGDNAFKVDKNEGVVNYNAAPITPTLRATPPAPPAHFTGREADLTKFTRLLTSGTSVAITALHGMGGIGKTSLAQKLAERVRDDFPGGVLWWTLGPSPDVMTALDVWARHADPRADLSSLPTAQARAEVVRSMLGQLGRLCVIIDDVWDADSFHILHSAIPSGCALMITTRDADLAKSLRCRVERIDALSDDEAVDLLINLLGPLNGHEDAACDIAHLTEGLPLALELIAGLADSPADLPALAQKLRTKPMLDVLKRGTTREQSIEACFTMSYEHLDAELQRRFMALGAFALAPFDRNAIAAVWADEDTDAVDNAIRLLVRRSLLTCIAQDDTTVEYNQHALLHDYAVKLLKGVGPLLNPPPSATGEEAPTPSPVRGSINTDESATTDQRTGEGWDGGHLFHSRHAAYYRTFAKEQPWRSVEHFFDQIDHGWQWVQANAPEQIIGYVFAVRIFFNLRGRPLEHIRWQNIALTQARAAKDRKNEGVILNNIAYVYDNLGQMDEALNTYQQALAIRREVGDRSGEGATLNNIGEVYRARGQMDKALDHSKQALAIRREVGDRSGEGTTLNNIGEVYRARGQLTEALDFYQQALAIHREVGNRSMEGTTLNNIGAIYNARGQLTEALDTYEQALAIHREVGNRSVEGTTLNNIGHVYSDLGQLDEALDTYQQALAICREVGDRSGEGTTLNNIGMIYKARGQLDEALDTYQQALAIRREVGNRSGEGTTLNNIGMIYKARGQMDEALGTFQQALAIHREVGDRAMEGTTLMNMGAIHQSFGRMDEALRAYQQAVTIDREVGNRYMEGLALWNMGALFEQTDRLSEAEDVLQEAVTALRECSSPQADQAQQWLERVRGQQ